MQKTLILGVLFACTSLIHTSNHMGNSPSPIAKNAHASSNFEHSIRLSAPMQSPTPVQNLENIQNFSFRIENAAKASPTPLASTEAQENAAQELSITSPKKPKKVVTEEQRIKKENESSELRQVFTSEFVIENGIWKRIDTPNFLCPITVKGEQKNILPPVKFIQTYAQVSNSKK